MKKLLAAVVLVVSMLVPAAASAAAPRDDPTRALEGIWHRLNPQQSQSNPAPEHEALTCHRRVDNGALAWACRYFKIPEPELNFAWNTTTARAEGTDVSATWACPAWFAPTVCAEAVQVVEANFVFVSSSGSFSADLDLIVTQTAAGQTLYVYWPNSFVCPWFRTFDEALAANPFPLPFDGVDGPPGDCVVAP